MPAAPKVVDGDVAGALPPAASALMVLGARSVTVPPPLADVAVWKKFEKEAPVEVEPVFEIVEENVCATFVVAVVGVGAAAVRLVVGQAAGAVAATALEAAEVPLEFEALTL